MSASSIASEAANAAIYARQQQNQQQVKFKHFKIFYQIKRIILINYENG